MSEVTTIKVTKPFRERVAAAAAERGQTAQRFLEHVLDEHDRRERLAAVEQALRDAPTAVRSEWLAESQAWEAADRELDEEER